jgi:hypothetical protein
VYAGVNGPIVRISEVFPLASTTIRYTIYGVFTVRPEIVTVVAAPACTFAEPETVEPLELPGLPELPELAALISAVVGLGVLEFNAT